MPLNTTSAAALLRPEEIHDLVVRPVQDGSVALRVATVVFTNSTNYRVPVVVSDPGAGWVGEGEEIPLGDVNLTEIVVTPGKVARQVPVTRELADDASPEATNLVGQRIAEAIADSIDSAFFSSVATPAPDGLADLVGVGVVSAGASWSNLDWAAEALAQAEQVGATITSFVANPADALLLAKIRDQTGSNRRLLGTDATADTTRRVSGVPLLVSPAVAPGVVWGIPQDRVLAIIRTDTRIDVSDQALFTSDRLLVRGTMRVGFAFPHAAAVQRVSLTAP